MTPGHGDRDLVLARIRAALGRDSAPAIEEWTREYRRQGEYPPGSAEALELLVDRLVDYRATVLLRPDAVTGEAVGAAVAEAVAGIDGLPAPGRVLAPAGLDADWLAGLVGAGHVVLRDPAPGDPDAAGGPGAGGPLDVGALDRVDLVVTGCAVAVAETGTLVLDGSGTSGRRAISLVPDRHLVVVRAEQVVQTVPEAIARVRPEPAGASSGIRPLTLVSGPSATSDIELQRVEGVHGPRTLLVVITG